MSNQKRENNRIKFNIIRYIVRGRTDKVKLII